MTLGTREAMRPANRGEFNVAIVCALPLEADAVKALFDDIYDQFDRTYGVEPGDKNIYTAGKIGPHNVVLCYLPGIGKVGAAATAANIPVSYSNIELVLLVGICGAVPFPPSKTEIMLGDVIISDSVVQYDFGRQYPDGFCPKSDVLGKTSPKIRSFLSRLGGRSTQIELQDRVYQYLQTLQARAECKYPGMTNDVLFEGSYRHKHYLRDTSNCCICFECFSSSDPVCGEATTGDCVRLGCAGSIIERKRHTAVDGFKPLVHIGKFASADRVMKSGEHRDSLAAKEGVIAFEMEAAGIWDYMPCVIIKGVSDYADSHKNKIWQQYAASTAACCSKAFLQNWPSSSQHTSLQKPPGFPITSSLTNHYTAARRLHILRISGETLPMDHCYINLAIVEQPFSAKKGKSMNPDPFSLFTRLKADSVKEERQVSLINLFQPQNLSNGEIVLPKRVFIQGRAGVGKTTLCKKIIHDHLFQGMWREQFDLILWIPLRRLKALSKEAPTLESVLYTIYFSELTRGMDTAAELAQSLLDPCRKDKILLILDGLDEVSQEWEPETPMQNLLFRLLDHSRVIITSRPYGMRTGLGILDSFDLQLETVGFTPDQVHSYIRKITDPQKADNIISFVQRHELIKGLVRIPILLDAVCYSWHRNFLSKDQPTTMTALYQAITLKLMKKDVLRLEKSNIHKRLNQHNVNDLSTFQVQELASKEMELVQLLAFTGMCNEIIEYNADDRGRIYNILGHSGLLLPDDPEAILRKISFLHTSDITVTSPDQSYHFLHLTFQEFFAARYFVQCWVKNEELLCVKLRQQTLNISKITPQCFLQMEKYTARYDILWRFATGLLQGVPGYEQHSDQPLKDYFEILEGEPRDILGPIHQQVLMNCLSEVVPHPESSFDRALYESNLLTWLEFSCDVFGNASLAERRECPEYIIDKLLYGTVQQQRCALDALVERNSCTPALLNTVLQLMRGDNDIVKRTSVKLLSKSVLPPPILEAMFPLPADIELDASTSYRLDQQLSKFPEILERQLRYLENGELYTRCSIAGTLARQSCPPQIVLDALVRSLKGPNKHVKIAIIGALSKRNTLQSVLVDALLQLLSSEERQLRSITAKALAKQDPLPESILSALLQIVEDSDQPMRENIALILGERQIMTQTVLEALRSILCKGKESTTVSCLRILAPQPSLPPEMIEVLVPLLNDYPYDDVPELAAEALRNQGSLPPAILESVASLLTDHDGLVRFHVLEILERHCIFPSTNESLLLSCGEDDQFITRVSVARILHHKLSHIVEESHNIPVNDAAMKPYLDRAQEHKVHLSTEEILQIMPLLWDDHTEVRKHTAELVGKQSPLPPTFVDALVKVMREEVKFMREDSDIFEPAYILSKHSSIPPAAIESLRPLLRVPSQAFHAIMAIKGMPNLPPAIFEDLFKLLSDEASQKYEFLDLIEMVLREHGQIQSGLHRKYWGPLYEAWLNSSFGEHMAIYLKDDCLYLQGSLKVAFQPKQLRVFRQEIRKKQLELGIPDQFLIPHSNTNNATHSNDRAQGARPRPTNHVNKRRRTHARKVGQAEGNEKREKPRQMSDKSG
ncbi:hypothetical protein BJX64DRAFT_285795 [Aspergillus heterothallicus]